MTSGQVALYVLAVLSSGLDPQQVHSMGRTVDLVSILQQKTDEEVAQMGKLGWEGQGVLVSPQKRGPLPAVEVVLGDQC